MDGTAQDPRQFRMAGGLLALGLGLGALGALAILPAAQATLASSAQSTPAPASALVPRYQVPVASSHPSLGAPSALVTIVEWCDLRSRACAGAEATLQGVLARYPDQVRLVHRHLSQRQSPSSQLLHHVAEGVHRHSDKFWEFRSRLLSADKHNELGEGELKARVQGLPTDWGAIEAGFDDMGYAQAVNADAIYAWRFGVTNGLGIFVNGRRVPTHDPSWRVTLRETVEEELSVAQALITRGIALNDVYETLTRDGYSSIDDATHGRRSVGLASR